MGLLVWPSPNAPGPRACRGHPPSATGVASDRSVVLWAVWRRIAKPAGGIRVATPLETWVDEAAKLTKPERVVYCDGSEAEYHRMIAEMLRGGDSFPLNEKTYPNCHLHRSSPNDVARTEHLTYICSPDKDNAGPTNN